MTSQKFNDQTVITVDDSGNNSVNDDNEPQPMNRLAVTAANHIDPDVLRKHKEFVENRLRNGETVKPVGDIGSDAAEEYRMMMAWSNLRRPVPR